MPRQSVNPIIVRSYARRYSIEQLDEAIDQLSEAFLTSSFGNLNVLGMSVGQSKDDVENLLETLEASKTLKEEESDTDVAAVNLDAIKPLGVGFDFSSRMIE